MSRIRSVFPADVALASQSELIAAPETSHPPRSAERVAWVDVAKGLCIVLVVMMHSTLGVGEAFGREGWLHPFVAFAKPFRMPDFFLIAGLFAAGLMTRRWREFADRKVLHFLYFLVIWTLIQFALKEGGLLLRDPPAGLARLALSVIEPYGTLWFLALLPVLFVATRLLWSLPAPLVLALGAGLEIAHLQSDWTLLHEFPRRFVYFYAGARFAPFVFAAAVRAANLDRMRFVFAFAAWLLFNGTIVALGLGDAPGVSLAAGAAGALAVVAFAVRVAPTRTGRVFAAFGRQSLVIYLAFFLPMAALRTVLLRTGVVTDVGLASALVTAAAVLVPLLLEAATRRTPLSVLFRRPDTISIAPRGRSRGLPTATLSEPSAEPRASRWPAAFRGLHESRS